MSEDLNRNVSSVFTRISVHYHFQMLNFRRLNLDYLEQLIVPPEMVAKKIKAMKDNKLHGINGS